MKHVVLVNAYGDANRGSCALNVVAIERIKAAIPGCSISLIPIARSSGATDFSFTQRYFPDLTILKPLIHPRSTLDTLRLLATGLRNEVRSGEMIDPDARDVIAGADLVVSRGGVILHSQGRTLGAAASTVTRLAALVFAAQHKVPTVLFGAQVGPCDQPLGRRTVRQVVESASLALPRGEISERTARRLAPESRLIRMPDSVFALGDMLADAPAPATGEIILVVSGHGRPEEVARRVSTLEATGCALGKRHGVEKLSVLCHCDDDKPATLALARALGLDESRVHSEPPSLETLIGIYRRAALVVSYRLHAVVLSLICGTPALSLATGMTFKEGEVLSEVGLGDLALPAGADATTIAASCERILEDDSSWRARIRESVQDARQRWATGTRLIREIA